MSVVRRHIAEGAVSPGKLYAALSDGSYAYEKFNYAPAVTKSSGYGDPTGLTGDINIALFRKLNASYHVKGAGQTILGPLFVAAEGTLSVEQDQVDAEGVEYIFGQANEDGNPLGLTIGAGSGKDRFARLKFKIADVSGALEAAFGFRKFQTFQAAIDDYTDSAVLNVQSGTVNIETILNNAATVVTDSGKDWLDAETHELKVVAQNDGKVRFYFDGQEVYASPAFTFDATDFVLPFFFFLNGPDVAGAVEFVEFEAGAVEDVDDSRIL